jgi:hypothetical protein
MGKEIAAFDYEEERKKFKWDIPEDYNLVILPRGTDVYTVSIGICCLTGGARTIRETYHGYSAACQTNNCAI